MGRVSRQFHFVVNCASNSIWYPAEPEINRSRPYILFANKEISIFASRLSKPFENEGNELLPNTLTLGLMSDKEFPQMALILTVSFLDVIRDKTE